jgi:heterodisulfide reductase subunit D
MARAESFQVQIRRYDPGREPAAYVETYELDYHPSMTVLEVLEEIQSHQDDSLAFRSSCRIGKCGSCAVSLNGRPVLACRAMVGGRDIRLEPLSGHPVVKDLIVDRSRPQERQVYAVRQAATVDAARVLFVPLADTGVDYANLSRCIGCLVCDASCPVLTAQAEDTFAGPAFFPAALGAGIGVDEETASQSFRCLLCEACTFACPSAVVADHLLEAARAELAHRGLLPQPLVALDRNVVGTHNISGEPNQNRLMWTNNLRSPARGLGKEKAEVVYFVGCVSAMFPRTFAVAQTFVQILERANVDYGLLGEDEWCCGYPLFLSGELNRAEEAIRHNVAAIRAMEANQVVMTCPSCFHFFRDTYPGRLEGEPVAPGSQRHSRGSPLGFEVRHATEFLADLLEAGRLPLSDEAPERVVTYHDPCDLGRKGGVFEAPRRILARLPGVTLVEMEENREGSHCCGGGGNLETFDPEMAKAVAARRIRQVTETGAGMVVSACQQCERTLFSAARAEGIRVRVKDIAEIVWEAMERS